MLKEKSVSKMILSCFPDWAINSISFLGEGDFCAAYLINDDWVFRFAKHQEARKSLQREYCLLPKISSEITLQIPNPQFVSFKPQPAFSAYRYLSDSPLSQEKYLQLNERDKIKSAIQIAQFLNEFHSIDSKLAQNCGVKVNDYQSKYSNLLVEARGFVFPILEKIERDFVEETIEKYLAENHIFQPVLLHGDLSPDHVLFNEKTNSVSGIIDFGDMMIGDPVWDLLWIYEDYGLNFLAKLLPEFHETNKTSLFQRLFQFSMLNLIEWTIHCKKENSEELEESLSELSKMRLEKDRRFDELIRACKIG